MADTIRLPTTQRSALFRIKQNQDDTYGVIIEPMPTAAALIRRGLAIKARRRDFARQTGLCLALTQAGIDYCNEIEGIPNGTVSSRP